MPIDKDQFVYAITVLEAEKKRQLMFADQEQETVARLLVDIAEAEASMARHQDRAAACQRVLDVLEWAGAPSD